MIALETPCPVVYASKYVYRWRKKNGLQDLDKALHCLLKAEECNLQLKQNKDLVEEFLTTNKVHTNDAYVIREMLKGNYVGAMNIIKVLVIEEEECGPTPSYVNQGAE
jgi:hypothetical protein